MIVALSRSWGVAPGYDEHGLRPILSYYPRYAKHTPPLGMRLASANWPKAILIVAWGITPGMWCASAFWPKAILTEAATLHRWIWPSANDRRSLSILGRCPRLRWVWPSAILELLPQIR